MAVKPRQSNEVTYALFAKDDAARALAREVLARDPKITLVEGNAPESEHCFWAAAHGAELYAVASVDAAYDSTFECTNYKLSFSKNGGECTAGYEKDKHTAASYTLTTYESATCKPIPQLEAKFSARVGGEEEQSRPEALATLAERVRAKSLQLPEQVTIDSEGRIVGDAPDGFYAVYRQGKYRGYVERRGEYLTPRYFPMELQPGDTLVQRGRRKFAELAFDLTASRLDGKFAAGPGVHLRHYALDGGFQVGLGADALLGSGSQMNLLNGELGYGVPIAPGFLASANVSFGFAIRIDGDVSKTDPAITPMLRLQTFLTTWWFVAVEAGVLISDEKAPISRVTVGFDL